MGTPCEQAGKVDEIDKRLNKGEVLFAEMSKDIKLLITNAMDAKVQRDRIETQTTKTNGRVTRGEEWQADMKVWQDAIKKEVSTLKKVKAWGIGLICGVAVASSNGPEIIATIIEVIK